MTSPIAEAQDRLQRFTFSSKRYGAGATRTWLEKASRRRGLAQADREALKQCVDLLTAPEDVVAAVGRCRRILARVKTRGV